MSLIKTRTNRALALFVAATLLAACGGGDDDGDASADPPGSGNSAPTISGSPPHTVMQESPYAFMPSADDADDDSLTFSVENLPTWAEFDTQTGRVSGTPGSGDLGTYDNIGISVSDGDASASLGAFSVTVVATAAGAATLSWSPPTERTDGSPLNDLDGYKIYWGTSQGNYTESATVDEGVTTYIVEELTPATWYFVATAFDSAGIESQFSNTASKTIN